MLPASIGHIEASEAQIIELRNSLYKLETCGTLKTGKDNNLYPMFKEELCYCPPAQMKHSTRIQIAKIILCN